MLDFYRLDDDRFLMHCVKAPNLYYLFLMSRLLQLTSLVMSGLENEEHIVSNSFQKVSVLIILKVPYFRLSAGKPAVWIFLYYVESLQCQPQCQLTILAIPLHWRSGSYLLRCFILVPNGIDWSIHFEDEYAGLMMTIFRCCLKRCTNFLISLSVPTPASNKILTNAVWHFPDSRSSP